MIYYDNQICIKISKTQIFHGKSRHIEIRYNFIQDRTQKGVVKLHCISIVEHVADILTKPLEKGKYVFLRDKLALVKNTILSKREF
jgi:hypothetical protein